MFYSQFILAKKGPLGTIWIAAHLERKLRKNQVADTDIGVSVDSILFPDVPIALRLSSHLLLGVVRIYSRKVNYLFDDCSDTLLKIKQAFRSTAVDLPPEESTAPYHSITLPETFDLDDFELPDNDVFQGNYVDHHISTKEQITLQDTMEGVVYSTSQFGLDERFGDGDTSQIGLDLAEDLFLDKLAAPGHAGVMLNSDADPQTSFQPITPFEEDENNEEMNETSQAMAAGVSGNQDYAEAPSTPGLVEEPNLSNVQKALACDDHLETEDHNSTDLEAIESVVTPSCKSDHHGEKLDLKMTPDGLPVEENGYDLGGNDIQHLMPKGDLLTTSENVEHVQNGVLSNNEASVDLPGVGWNGTVSSPSSSHGASKDNNCHIPCSGVENITEKFISSSTQLTVAEGIPENDQALLPEICSNVEISKNVEDSCTPNDALAPNAFSPLEPAGPEANVEDQVHHERKECKTLDPSEEMLSTGVYVLQPCNSDLNQSKKLSLGGDSLVAPSDLPNDIDGPGSLETSGMEEAIHASGMSTEIQGEECHPTAAVKPFSEANVMSEPNLSEDIETNRSYLDAVSIDTLEFPNSSAFSELPAPEKLLSMPEGPSNLLNDLLLETTPDKVAPEESEGDGTGIRITSGKKRSFTESTLTLQSLNSDESFAKPQSKRTTEFIPDDDDLLSSILVGRRSSILKMKPTPTPSQVVPMKRPRTTSRVSASKRKVLMDDSMVLHGDTIRQQLTSTEDIRRVRKKAPSTRHEIWMMQKQFLEDELFSEPISTGMSIELIGLYNQTYDLSSIRISLDENFASLDSVNREPTVRPNVIKRNETEGSTEISVVRIDEEAQPTGILVHTEIQQGEDNSLGSRENDTQLQMDATLADIEVKTSNLEHGEIAEMEIDGGSVEVADAAECAVAPGLESSYPIGPVSDVSLQMHASCLPPDQEFDFQSVDKDASILDLSNGNGIDAVNDVEIHNDIILEFETESGARGQYGAEVGEILEVRADSCTGSCGPTDIVDHSITTTSPETVGCKDLNAASNNLSMEEIAKDEPDFLKEHEVIATDMGYDNKNPASSHMSCEEPTADSSYLVECDVKNTSLDGGETASFNDVERPSCLEAEAHGIMDPENTCVDHHVIEDHGEMENIIVEHDTEFLNVDDDDVAEEDDNYMPSAEETRFLENSGWSSRTRAVAKYLQTLFDKEAELGKKVIPMENLLSGKTRKEASRMFFETLVLKTRDYIHVEQQNPFNNINIKPRGKLMKSDF